MDGPGYDVVVQMKEKDVLLKELSTSFRLEVRTVVDATTVVVAC